MTARIVWTVIAVALLGAVGLKISTAKSKAATSVAPKLEPALVRTTKVTRADLSEGLTLTGTVRPRSEVDVFAKVGGRVEKLYAQVGDKVRAGEVLAEVEHREIGWQAKQTQAAVMGAQAAVKLAEAGLAGAQLELDRTKALFEGGSAPQVALDGARIKLDVANAQVLQAKAGVAQAEAAAGLMAQQVANARIEAPIAGTVVRKVAQLGMSVGQQLAAFTIQDLSTLKMETSVDALTWTKVRRGRPVEITTDALPGERFKGRIDVISPTLDPATRRAAVEILIDNARGLLLPNTFSRGQVTVRELPKVLALPRDAVLDAPGGAVVFRVKGGKAEKVRPEFGPTDGSLLSVLSGLEEGDEVALSGLGALADGQDVRTAPATTAAVETPPASVQTAAKP